MWAYFIDLLFRFTFMYVASITLTLIGSWLGAEEGFSFSTGVILLLWFLMEWGYSTLFEALWNGQTPGKRLLHIRVIKTAGYPIHFYDAAIRNLLRAADILPILYGIGLLSMIFTKRMQRLGDLVASTMVVIEDRSRFERSLLTLERVPVLEPLDCTRTYHVSERTLDVIERLFDPRRPLSLQRREEIGRGLAKVVAEHLGYDPETDPQVSKEDRQPASRFLIRVLKTFGRTQSHGDDSTAVAQQDLQTRMKRAKYASSIPEFYSKPAQQRRNEVSDAEVSVDVEETTARPDIDSATSATMPVDEPPNPIPPPDQT